MTTITMKQRAQAETYLQTLTRSREYGFGLAVYRAMTVGATWPERPKGLGQSRSREILCAIGDIVGKRIMPKPFASESMRGENPC